MAEFVFFDIAESEFDESSNRGSECELSEDEEKNKTPKRVQQRRYIKTINGCKIYERLDASEEEKEAVIQVVCCKRTPSLKFCRLCNCRLCNCWILLLFTGTFPPSSQAHGRHGDGACGETASRRLFGG